MKEMVTNNERNARVVAVALAMAVVLLTVSYQAGSDIAGAVLYGAFLSSLVNALAVFSYSLLSSEVNPRTHNPA